MNRPGRLREFSSVVGRIYDAAVDAAIWPEALGRLCALFDGAVGTLNYHEVIGEGGVLAVEFCTDARGQLYVERYAQRNPIIPGFLCHEVGTVFQIRDVVNVAEYEESRFYEEWLKPQGYKDLMGAVIRRDELHVGAVGLARRKTDGPYAVTDIEAFKLVAEHLRRAAQISDLSEHRKNAVTTFENVLNQVASAVIVIDDTGQVNFCNPAALRLFDQGQVGTVVGGRLSLASISLADLITTVRNRQACVAALPQSGPDGTPLSLTAFALRADPGRTYGAPIAIFISGERTVIEPPPALLAEMYALTGGELRILLALLEGIGPGAIAVRFGISIATVRTHLARLFEKTGSTGQVELVRKVAAVLPPVSVPKILR
jgi:DNA-binding CsgD family transcriptional regulator/PAS domain-containing protein